MPGVIVPCDWDHQSLCIEDGCISPATHKRMVSVAEDTIDDGDLISVVEMVCCQHAAAVPDD